MIEPEEALKIILEETKIQHVEEVNLLDSLGYVLAENIISEVDIPPFDNSAMDGYAVCSVDTRGALKDKPCELKVIGDLPAGIVSKIKISSGLAMRIMTGAPIPEGADAVVKKEDTDLSGQNVKIFCETKEDENVRRAGEDIAKGEKVLLKGTQIKPAQVGLLASLGEAKICIYKPPTVAILSTGDELIEIDEPLQSGKIRNSNTYTLTAQVLSVGARPFPLGIASDTFEATEKLIKQGLNSDVLITTGGVSMGEYDVVKEVLAKLGAELKFWKVAQKPGMPMAFWKLGEKLIFGLPGNPVATALCFEEYVRPSLLKMMGRKFLFRPEVEAILEHDFKKKAGRAFFARVKVRVEDGKCYVSVTGPQGSGILKSMALAEGIALIPKEVSFLEAGSKVKVHLVEEKEDH